MVQINCAMFKLNKLNTHQQKGTELFVNEEKDTVVNLATGRSKSIIYQGLPVLFDVQCTGTGSCFYCDFASTGSDIRSSG